MVPQHGHGAVGEAARIVMVTSLVIHTCSIARSERSGMMVIGSHWIWKTSRWRICLVLQYTTCGISEPAEEPYPRHFLPLTHISPFWQTYWVKQQIFLQFPHLRIAIYHFGLSRMTRSE